MTYEQAKDYLIKELGRKHFFVLEDLMFGDGFCSSIEERHQNVIDWAENVKHKK